MVGEVNEKSVCKVNSARLRHHRFRNLMHVLFRSQWWKCSM